MSSEDKLPERQSIKTLPRQVRRRKLMSPSRK